MLCSRRFGGAVAGSGARQGEGGGEEEAELLQAEEALLVADRLHLVVRPFLLRRLKAHVAAELPHKVLK